MSGESYHQREIPHLPGRVAVEKRYTPTGAVYVPVHSEVHEPQPIRREVYRTRERRIVDPDGTIRGVETTHEHDVSYGKASRRPRRRRGEIGTLQSGVLGIACFVGACVVWELAGGARQSYALIPVYWGAALIAWRLLVT